MRKENLMMKIILSVVGVLLILSYVFCEEDDSAKKKGKHEDETDVSSPVEPKEGEGKKSTDVNLRLSDPEPIFLEGS